MQYLKRNTKYDIFTFFIIVLFITISISTLAKTEIYFSLYDNPQKEIIKNINQTQAFINIAMYAFPSPAQKIITLRDSLSGGFKKTTSSHPIARDFQSRTEGMERTGNNSYY